MMMMMMTTAFLGQRIVGGRGWNEKNGVALIEK